MIMLFGPGVTKLEKAKTTNGAKKSKPGVA